MLNKSPWMRSTLFVMHCKAQILAIARLWQGFATLQGAQSEVLRATRDLFSIALREPQLFISSIFVFITFLHLI
jgi:hypothetical protein